jgi:hypothetical protein
MRDTDEIEARLKSLEQRAADALLVEKPWLQPLPPRPLPAAGSLEALYFEKQERRIKVEREEAERREEKARLEREEAERVHAAEVAQAQADLEELQPELRRLRMAYRDAYKKHIAPLTAELDPLEDRARELSDLIED